MTQYELQYGKRGAVGSRNSLKRDHTRFDSLPDVPPQYDPMVGSYRDVSERAKSLNEVQLRSSFLDYLFFPELRQTAGASK